MFATTDWSRCCTSEASSCPASQVHRLVTGTPERLSLHVLAALCDILEVTPADLIVTDAANAAPRAAAAGAAVADLAGRRPTPGAHHPLSTRVTDYPGRPFIRTRARLQARLAELLDDGTGRIRP